MSGAVRVTAREQQGWTAISAAEVHLLVHWDEDAPGVALLRAAASTGELDDVLDVLARGGVRQAPDFAAVREASPARVVTRGTAYAVASGPQGEVEMRATGRGPWADEDAPADATSIALHTGRPVPAVPEQPTSPAAALENHAPAPAGWRLPSRLAGDGPAPATPPVGMPPTEARLQPQTSRPNPRTCPATTTSSAPPSTDAPRRASSRASPRARPRSSSSRTTPTASANRASARPRSRLRGAWSRDQPPAPTRPCLRRRTPGGCCPCSQPRHRPPGPPRPGPCPHPEAV